MTTTRYELPTTVSHCTGRGGNVECKAAHKRGLSVHIIPGHVSDQPRLVMPTYHYATEEEAREAVRIARLTAPTVTCDDDLYACRRMRTPHFLPVNWIDPTRRR